MVVYEGHEMLSSIDTPLFRAVLPVQRMCDLKHVHAVKTGVDPLVTFVVCTAVQHLVIYDQIIISKEYFTDQRKARFELFAEMAEPLHEVVVQTVSNIQSEPVDPEFLDPHFHTVEQIVDNCRILKVQLDQLVMSFPSLVPESVIVAAISVKIDTEPVFVRRIPFLFLNILKCPETSSYMIEHAVEHDFYIVIMKRLTDLFEVVVRAKTAVDLCKISRIVAVIVRFKNRI